MTENGGGAENGGGTLRMGRDMTEVGGGHGTGGGGDNGGGGGGGEVEGLIH